MSYITLYRKYRPQLFDNVVGQEHVTRTLKNAVDHDKVAHAYLFCGQRGTGKTTTARILSKAVNCAEGPTSRPCGKCFNCLSITEGSSMDVLEVDAASNRGIDEIRDLREKVNFAPVNCFKKVYIIDEVHMLTAEASNALLKMMEEPPEHVIFILATTEPHKVLPTILSRCQRFDFRRVSLEDIAGLLQRIAGEEKIKIDKACLGLIAKQSQGSVRDAIGVLDQLGSYNEKEIKEKDVLSLLNIYEDDLLFDFAQCIIERKTPEALKMADRLIESGRDLRHFVNSLIEHFREVFLLITTDEAETMIAKSRQSIERLKEQAKNMALWEALKVIDMLSGCSSDMRWSTDTRLLFEIALVKLTKLEADLSLEGLLSRVEKLEKQVESMAENRGLKSDREIKDKVQKNITESKPKNKNLANETQNSEADKKKNDNKAISIEKVERIWPVILEQVKKQSIPVYSLLLQCHPAAIEANQIVLEFNTGADFHMKEIEKVSNQSIINKAIIQAMGKEYRLMCRLGSGKKQQQSQKVKTANLPSEHMVKLMKDTFGAEIIEETSLNARNDTGDN